MKTRLLFILIIFLNAYCYSQISYESGYYVDESNQKIKCLIKNIDWKNNPSKIEYKLTELGASQTATIESVKEFGIYNVSKYIRSSVNIDRSSENVNKLSKNINPEFKEELLFLKVLIEGKASLYAYNDINLKRFFYGIPNSNIEQLIFKNYKTLDNNIKENTKFREQLWNNLKCQDSDIRKFTSLDYEKDDLVGLFIEYNACNNHKITYIEKKQNRDLFNLNIRPRLTNSSLNFEYSPSYSARDSDFGNKTNFGFGLEAEIILSFNKNKWAIIIEPTYQSYNSEKTLKETGNLYGGELTTKVNYNSIELPVGLRHYFFINKNSKIFINASYIVNFSFNSSVEYIRKDGFALKNPEVTPSNNLGFGFGYKYNDVYSLELRYHTSRDILSNFQSAKTDYKSISVVFGYNLF